MVDECGFPTRIGAGLEPFENRPFSVSDFTRNNGVEYSQIDGQNDGKDF